MRTGGVSEKPSTAARAAEPIRPEDISNYRIEMRRAKNRTRARGRTRKVRKHRTATGPCRTATGGQRTIVDVRQITITDPIINAIKSLTGNDDIDLSMFKRQKGPQGFALPRLEDVRSKNIRANLEQYPIELEPIRNRNGASFGIMIDGERKPIYSIINGRHRFAKAVAEGLTEVSAIIQ